MKWQWNNLIVGDNITKRTVLQCHRIRKVENHWCIGSYIWVLGPRTFRKLYKLAGGNASLGEGLKVLKLSSISCSLFASWQQMQCDQPLPSTMVSLWWQTPLLHRLRLPHFLDFEQKNHLFSWLINTPHCLQYKTNENHEIIIYTDNNIYRLPQMIQWARHITKPCKCWCTGVNILMTPRHIKA